MLFVTFYRLGPISSLSILYLAAKHVTFPFNPSFKSQDLLYNSLSPSLRVVQNNARQNEAGRERASDSSKSRQTKCKPKSNAWSRRQSFPLRQPRMPHNFGNGNSFVNVTI